MISNIGFLFLQYVRTNKQEVNDNVAAPEDYMEQIVKVSEGVDAYLSKN